MAQRVELSFILPKADPEFLVDQLELIGLNNLDERTVDREKMEASLADVANVKWVEGEVASRLMPYLPEEVERSAGHAESTAVLAEKQAKVVAGEKVVDRLRAVGLDDRLAMFQGDNLYGEDVGERVWAYAQVAASLAEDMDFDIVHAHDWMTFVAGMEIKKRTGKPLVLHVHSLNYDRGGPDSRGWIFDIEKNAMEAADLIIPVSRYTGTICTGHYGIDPRKVHFVHNGADPVDTFRSASPFKDGLVLFLGRLTGQKGPRYFLEIAARVLEKNPGVYFVMAGTGEKMRELIEYGAYRDVGDRLHFTGFLNKEKVNKLLSMTDVYCMPSVSEPFGLSAIEAAQYGIPAVISKQSGVAEVMTHARKADFWDVNLMADHITELLTDPKAREEAIQHSLADQKNCTWEAASDRIIELYRDQLGIQN
ncbi:glycosyltransferase [Roseibacillus ishigakijimensis]